MPKKPDKRRRFPRADAIQVLQDIGDRGWVRAACDDLEELSADDAGAERLAAAIRALLRQSSDRH